MRPLFAPGDRLRVRPAPPPTLRPGDVVVIDDRRPPRRPPPRLRLRRPHRHPRRRLPRRRLPRSASSALVGHRRRPAVPARPLLRRCAPCSASTGDRSQIDRARRLSEARARGFHALDVRAAASSLEMAVSRCASSLSTSTATTQRHAGLRAPCACTPLCASSRLEQTPRDADGRVLVHVGRPDDALSALSDRSFTRSTRPCGARGRSRRSSAGRGGRPPCARTSRGRRGCR